MDDHANRRGIACARRMGAFALVACAAMTSACLRSNAQSDDRNPNGPGSLSHRPHNTSGPNVKNTAGYGYYGSQSWGPLGPGFGYAGPAREQEPGVISVTEQPGTTNVLPGTGNNGWGGPASPSHGVTGNGTTPWTQ